MTRHRILITPPESALRLKRCTALVELELPLGFHALPVDEQNRAVETAAGVAARAVQDELADGRMRRSA
jgi:hypothetical protein